LLINHLTYLVWMDTTVSGWFAWRQCLANCSRGCLRQGTSFYWHWLNHRRRPRHHFPNTFRPLEIQIMLLMP